MKNRSADIKMIALLGLAPALLLFICFSRLIVPVLPLMITGVVCFLTRTQRKFIQSETIPINQLHEGLVKVQGTLEGIEAAFESPFFKEPCIGYSYEQADIWYDDDGQEQIRNIIQRNDIRAFYLADGSGKVKVKPDQLNLSFLSPQVRVIGHMKHSERILKRGEHVYILDTAVYA